LTLYTVVTNGADDVVSVDSGVYRNGQQGWTGKTDDTFVQAL